MLQELQIKQNNWSNESTNKSRFYSSAIPYKTLNFSETESEEKNKEELLLEELAKILTSIYVTNKKNHE